MRSLSVLALLIGSLACVAGCAPNEETDRLRAETVRLHATIDAQATELRELRDRLAINALTVAEKDRLLLERDVQLSTLTFLKNDAAKGEHVAGEEARLLKLQNDQLTGNIN